MEISDRFLFFLKNPKEIPAYVYDGSLVMGNMMNAAAKPNAALATRKADYIYKI